MLADFLPPSPTRREYKGVQYGLPFISSARLFFYNKDLFEKAGISEPPSRPGPSVEAAAKKMKKAGTSAGPAAGRRGGPGRVLHLGDEQRRRLDRQVGQWTDRQRANVETLNYLESYQGRSDPAEPGDDQPQGRLQQFAQGKVGMINGAVFMRTGFIDTVEQAS